jgi:hypothetical protein
VDTRDEKAILRNWFCEGRENEETVEIAQGYMCEEKAG